MSEASELRRCGLAAREYVNHKNGLTTIMYSYGAETRECQRFVQEASAANAWNLNLNDGNLNNWNNKVTNKNRVRAVSALFYWHFMTRKKIKE